MKQLKMKAGWIAIDPKDSSLDNKTQVGGLIIPETQDSAGVVVYSNDSEFKVGDVIYYGPKREQIVFDGKRLYTMDSDNVFGQVIHD